MRLMVACRYIDNIAGGVERQAIALVNDMVKRGHEVCFFTLDEADAQAFYPIDERATWRKLDMGHPSQLAGWSLRFQRLKKIRGIIKEFQPDVILAFQDGMFVSLLSYTVGMGIPLIDSERESPYRYDFVKSENRDFIFRMLGFAKAITVQCPSYVEGYPANLQRKITVIPNSVYPANEFAKPGDDAQTKILLSVGRLTHQKHQLLLIDAFAQVADDFPEWKLVFVGDGEDRGAVEQKIEDMDLQNRVELTGNVKNVTDYYTRSHVLCIPSKWEGFPNVLAEALAHGLPAVGFEGCGGVRDLIHHGENGLLAKGHEDIYTLADSLRQIMGDDAMRERMGQAAIKSVEPYRPETVYDTWEEFLTKVKA